MTITKFVWGRVEKLSKEESRIAFLGWTYGVLSAGIVVVIAQVIGLTI